MLSRDVLLSAIPTLLITVISFVGFNIYNGDYFLSQGNVFGFSRSSSGVRGSQLFSPHGSSWTAWWHPERSIQKSAQLLKHRTQKWNILHHLGGNGPWIEKTDGMADEDIAPPEGCLVDQVHMMSRHAERYPTKKAGQRHLDLLARLSNLSTPLNNSLSFLNNWTYITQTPQHDFDQLTTTGPYAGTLTAFTTGVRLRTRYSHLLGSLPLHIWASDCQRVISTAEHFAAGFLGLDWNQLSSPKGLLEVIPETIEQGLETLTPGDTCAQYITDLKTGHDYGANMLAKFRHTYLPKIASRLVSDGNHALGDGSFFSDADIYAMQEMCGFETLVRRSSPWCDVFTPEDWSNFEYARDVIHYYRAGSGNRYSRVMGLVWLKRVVELLVEDHVGGDAKLFFSFVHDGDIMPMLAALDIFPSEQLLSITHRDDTHPWKTSRITPMGGRFILERLQCPASETTFVRININDAIVPHPECQDGPGGSCSLDNFVALIAKKSEEAGKFEDVCGVDDEVRKTIKESGGRGCSFLRAR